MSIEEQHADQTSLILFLIEICQGIRTQLIRCLINFGRQELLRNKTASGTFKISCFETNERADMVLMCHCSLEDYGHLKFMLEEISSLLIKEL